MDCTEPAFHHVATVCPEASACTVAEQIPPYDTQFMIQTAYNEGAAASSSKAKLEEDAHSATLPTVADSADLDMYLTESLDSAPLGCQQVSTAVNHPL